MSTTRTVRVVVINGRVVYRSDVPEPRTPREQARALENAAARWSGIVDLMLKGMRETGGGKVVEDKRLETQ